MEVLRAHCVLELSGQKYAVPTKAFLDGLWKRLHFQTEPELLTDVRLKWEQANLLAKMKAHVQMILCHATSQNAKV